MITKWVPTTELWQLRRLGKLGEELGELVAVTNRCIIQGINEVDPHSQKLNWVRLMEEMADVLAQIQCTTEAFHLSEEKIQERVIKKVAQMAEWEVLANGD